MVFSFGFDFGDRKWGWIDDSGCFPLFWFFDDLGLGIHGLIWGVGSCELSMQRRTLGCTQD